MEEILSPISPELQVLINNKESGYNYRQRRQQDWLENYTLYRDRVFTNRLTQRQSVNIPLMKTSIRTLLKDVDDMPVLYFENLDNDKQAELFKNEYWKYTVKENRMELQDIVDKRQVFLFGRSFDQWQIVDGKVKMTVQDPQDILVSRYCDPFNIHSSRFLIHTHIFVPLATLGDNPDYDKSEVEKLKKFYATSMGLIKLSDNNNMLEEKNRKLQAMGVPDVDSPVLGETYVELALHFVYDKRKDSNEEELFLKVEAEGTALLMKKPLAGDDGVIGDTIDDFWKTHFPYNSWADDLERQDFWSDSTADIIRTPNKILNSTFSQLIENRTLRNFNMNYYDATAENDFEPPSIQPAPGAWIPLPGKPSEVFQSVEVADLSESLDEIQFIITMAEKASGATSTQQGATQERQITLGEVQLALGEAKDRVKGMSKFYTPAWQQRGEMFEKLVEAGADKLDAVTIHKKGRNTDKIYSRDIEPGDWKSQAGYTCKVWSQDEKNAKDADSLQKLNAVKTNMPNNAKLDEIYKRKLLEFVDLSPDEINEVMEIEKQQQQQMMMAQQQLLQTGQQPQLMGGQAQLPPQQQTISA